MEMTEKELDAYVIVESGKFKDVMYKIVDIDYNHDTNGKMLFKFDYDVVNLPDSDKGEFDNWLGENLSRSLIYAIENDVGNI